jgi:hypothetical protein
MRPTSIAASVSVAALLAACGIGAPSYPAFGEATYAIVGAATPSDGSEAVNTTIYRDGPKMRVETLLGGRGQVSIVYDDNTGAAYIVTPASTVTPAPAPTTTTVPGTTSTTPATTTTTTAVAPVAAPVGGTAIRIEDSDAPKPLEEAWVTLGADNARAAGACSVAGEKGHRWTPRERVEGTARTACISEDGIVLEVMEGQTPIWRASQVTRGAQDPALFGVPAGYQVIDPQAVAQAVGDAMQDVGQVSGDPKTPPVAPAPAPAPATPKSTPKS